MRIGIDIMGGDFAPEATTLGAILAYKELSSDDTIVLIGDKEKIQTILDRENVDASNFEIVHSSEVIEMTDHPAKTFSKKQNSSIAIAYKLLASGKIDGLASAGSTGAMMVGAMYAVKLIPGVVRPVITAPIPRPDGGYTIFLDVGINPDCKPDVLYQYGILGSLYVENVYNIKNPKIGLLNIGSEEEKGNLVSKSTHELMKDTKDFNFIGNVEANEIFKSNKADVIVCDGFVGNVILKEAEAFYSVLKQRKIKDEFFEKFNFENYGGTPILGVNKNIIIGHGISNDTAIKNMILLTKSVVEVNLSEKIREIFK
ncbi:MAG: phosphate acyltransferase PlsX [Bacteroidales bacterium]|jgi:glycerol-3-phosphate acyltransferase PlsX|nr:phosphate acyltransferase PlsX [Bacteroidales bacterium]